MRNPTFLLLLIISLAVQAISASAAPADSKTPIRIGELNSYTAIPLYTLPYRKGWQLAVKERNAAGGVLGRQIEVIDRDDLGTPETAVRVAEELVSREKVALLSGTMFGHVGFALSDFCERNKVLFALWASVYPERLKRKSRYTFDTLSCLLYPVVLADITSQWPQKKWVTVAPNFAYGQNVTHLFKGQLSEKRPDIQWLGEFWPTLGKLDGGTTVSAIQRLDADVIFNTTFGRDLASFVRQGKAHNLFQNKVVISCEMGIPEALRQLGSEVPEGWIVTGYPSTNIPDAAHQKFAAAYRKEYKEDPDWMSLMGYCTYQFIFGGIEKAGSTDTEKLVAALENLTVDSPIGPLRMRAADHISTMGIWVGKTALVNGHGKLVDWKYYDGAKYLPPEDQIKTHP